MKILRIKLKNYRGVETREVTLAPSGVTVIEGPNEIGKSSLAEAVDVIFKHLDSSAKAEVKALKPVHKDDGAEIEVDVECGPYAFTLYKRFHKKPETRLTVSQPRPENLTGREAHERARKILAEELDLDLWDALRLQQGTGVAQAELKDQRSLAAALDHAAGGSLAGDREENLFEAARREYERYYTETGKPRKELDESDAALKGTQAELRSISEQLAAIEAEVERFARLENEIGRLRRERVGLEAAAVERDAEWNSVQGLVKELSTLDAKRKEAMALAKSIATEVEARSKLVNDAAEARRELDDLNAKIEAGALQRQVTKEEHDRSAQALKNAHDAAEETASLVELRRRDHEFRRDELDLAQLRERKARIDKAVREAEASERLLRRTTMTDALLADIENAHVAAEVARWSLEAARTELCLEALAEIDPEVAGVTTHLDKDQKQVLAVEGSLELRLPGVARVTVRSGASSATLAGDHKQAQSRLKALCDKGKVAGVTEARQVNEARREADLIRRRKDEVLKENLRDLTRDDLESKILELEARQQEPHPRHDSDPALPADLDEARDVLREAHTAAKAAADAQRGLTTSLDRAREACSLQEKKEVEDATRLKLTQERLDAAQKAIDESRSSRPDDVLGGEQEVAAASVQASGAAYAEAARRLAAAQPEQVKDLAQNAQAALESAVKQFRQKEDELLQLRTRLREHGEDGLEERRGAAQALVERSQLEHTGLLARAEAAKLLFNTLRTMRDAARQRYVGPLRKRIEGLGRIVFGESFQVSLDDELQVESRTVDGRTVPFKDLSIGAQEQIGVIVRLACAMTVSANGGVTVIVDDALGYSDPERLQEMGAVLSRAGRETQIVVLTCMPERYRYVGNARVVSLS